MEPVTEAIAPLPPSSYVPPAPAALVVEPCEFWFIWTKTGKVPRYSHNTEASAWAEADRLATRHPGKKFIVLRGYRKVHLPRKAPIPAPETTTTTHPQAGGSRGEYGI